jgi:hypothetical protein
MGIYGSGSRPESDILKPHLSELKCIPLTDWHTYHSHWSFGIERNSQTRYYISEESNNRHSEYSEINPENVGSRLHNMTTAIKGLL